MEDLVKIKRKLKDWELAFSKVHERKPSKDDIAQAPTSIKDLYRTYHLARKNSMSTLCSSNAENGNIAEVTLIATKPDENEITQEKLESSGGTLTKLENEITQEKLESSGGTLAKLENEITQEKLESSGGMLAKLEKSQMTPQHNSSQLTSVWGPELNRSALKADSQIDLDKISGGYLLGMLGDKLFAKCGSGGLSSMKAPKKNLFLTRSPKNCDEAKCSADIGSPGGSSLIQTAKGCSRKEMKEESDKVQGAVFERAIRLSVGKRLNSTDNAEVPKRFLQAGKPRRPFSLSVTQDFGKEGSDELDGNVVFSMAVNSCDSGVKDVGADNYSGSSLSAGFSTVCFQEADKTRSLEHPGLDDNGRNISAPTTSNPKTRSVLSMLDGSPDADCNSFVGRTPTGIKTTSHFAGSSDNEDRSPAASTAGKRTTCKSQQSHKNLSSLVGDDSRSVPSTPSVYEFQDHVEVYADNSEFAEPTPVSKGDDSDFSPENLKKEKKVEARSLGSGKRKADAATAAQRKRRKINKDEEEKSDIQKHDEIIDCAEHPENTKPTSVRAKAPRSNMASLCRKSDNFVKLNMKVKRFCRKGSRMTSGQYKRKQAQLTSPIRTQACDK